MRTVIVAEAGVNHNGSVETALRLVGAAAEAGADMVKFQAFRAVRVAAASAPVAAYQRADGGGASSQLRMLQRLELSYADYAEIASFCAEKGIEFLATPFDEESVDMLCSLGVRVLKIPSGEITNRPLVQYMASKSVPLILSTGMSCLGEIEKAIGWIRELWEPAGAVHELTLLHCTSSYPAPFGEVNLLAMKTLEAAFGLPVGYSDHTPGTEVAVAAVALGARVIEKHLTLDRDAAGPDHRSSLEPREFRALVEAVRNVEAALGDGSKRAAASEADVKAAARRSLVTTRDIRAGEVLGDADVVPKRPGVGIPPEFKSVVVGLEVKREIAADSVIRWEDFKDA
ncbi:MAG TPA: N-acetylneuraminate synthase [Nitrospirae bacterium]|nr:N-acetylneuraminate synthase [Nitrospirota bacterium]